ncbi:MAG: SufD family Fe-S cluster assembly protein [Firmicutes bacterium]|nr:SufD family Fe-S cluster assembly protein [Bacillota bacterium]
MELDNIQKHMLEQIAGLHEVPQGAYNLRSNGESIGRSVTENIDIVTRSDNMGIEIYIKPNTKNESVHIPVILSQSGLEDVVYNDFHIGENADVVIVAGCGIHNGGSKNSQHNGIHTFYVGKGARVKYIEKHYGIGDGDGKNIMNPQTIINIDDDGYMEMDSLQIKGVDSTYRITKGVLGARATLIVSEKILTHGSQSATTDFDAQLNGADCSAHIVSRSVARDNSKQLFISNIEGNSRCSGHTECDAILMDNGTVSAEPKITANCLDASLIHEAAIGKIAGEQLIKLMTLGLNEKEAEDRIINGFLQ